MFDSWPELLHSALLGTDKMALRPDQLPAHVQAWLERHPNLTAAEQLLSAAALQRTYELSGRVVTTPTLPDPDMAPEEALPYCSAEAVDIWTKIRQARLQIPHLETTWLRLCAHAQRIVPPILLVELLQLGSDRRTQKLQSDIVRVIGERGLWLSKYHDTWKYARLVTISPIPARLESPSLPIPEVRILRTLDQYQTDWSVEFSYVALDAFYAQWNGYNFTEVKEWMAVSVFLHPTVNPESTPKLTDTPKQRDFWLSKIVPELAQILNTKRDLWNFQTKF
jgi:hypothetical protein